MMYTLDWTVISNYETCGKSIVAKATNQSQLSLFSFSYNKLIPFEVDLLSSLALCIVKEIADKKCAHFTILYIPILIAYECSYCVITLV